MSSLVVEIFRSDDYVPDGEIPLVPVLGAVFADIIGPRRDGVVFELHFYQIMDLTPDGGSPAVENLRSSHGFVRVRILRDGELIYQHPHPIRELIGEPLRDLLRKRDPSVTHWGYGVRGPGLEAIALSGRLPQVAHEVRVPTGSRRRATFTVEEEPEPEPLEASLAAFGAVEEPIEAELSDAEAGGASDPADSSGAEGTPPIVVVIPGSIASWLLKIHEFSDEIEEGGFLAGTVYRDADRPSGYLVHVTAVLPAQRTGASMLNFTFTGESFLRVSHQLEDRGVAEKLLGWYHTHLFSATSHSGLSSVDVELHRSTFRRPWQVAALVNIPSRGRRVLRFYHGRDDEMALVPYWVVPDTPAEPQTPVTPAATEADADPYIAVPTAGTLCDPEPS